MPAKACAFNVAVDEVKESRKTTTCEFSMKLCKWKRSRINSCTINSNKQACDVAIKQSTSWFDLDDN